MSYPGVQKSAGFMSFGGVYPQPRGDNPYQKGLPRSYEGAFSHSGSPAISQDKVELFEPFFGVRPNNQGFEKSPYSHMWSWQQDNFTLPDAYIGDNPYTVNVLINGILQADQWPLVLCLPWKMKEDSMEVAWMQWHFTDHMLDRSPEETLPRMLTNTRTQHSKGMQRYGKALMFEDTFLGTPMGALHYAMSLKQIYNAIIETASLGVVMALMTNKPREDHLAGFRGSVGDISDMEYIRGVMEQAELMFLPQKNPNGWMLLLERARKTFKDHAHVDPNGLIVPQGITKYFRNLSRDIPWFINGDRTGGTSNLDMAAQGLIVQESREFKIGEHEKNTDPLFRELVLGAFGILNTRGSNTAPAEEYRTQMMNSVMYNELTDDEEMVEVAVALHYSGLWENLMTEDEQPTLGTIGADVLPSFSNHWAILKFGGQEKTFLKCLTHSSRYTSLIRLLDLALSRSVITKKKQKHILKLWTGINGAPNDIHRIANNLWKDKVEDSDDGDSDEDEDEDDHLRSTRTKKKGDGAAESIASGARASGIPGYSGMSEISEAKEAVIISSNSEDNSKKKAKIFNDEVTKMKKTMTYSYSDGVKLSYDQLEEMNLLLDQSNKSKNATSVKLVPGGPDKSNKEVLDLNTVSKIFMIDQRNDCKRFEVDPGTMSFLLSRVIMPVDIPFNSFEHFLEVVDLPNNNIKLGRVNIQVGINTTSKEFSMIWLNIILSFMLTFSDYYNYDDYDYATLFNQIGESVVVVRGRETFTKEDIISPGRSNGMFKFGKNKYHPNTLNLHRAIEPMLAKILNDEVIEKNDILKFQGKSQAFSDMTTEEFLGLEHIRNSVELASKQTAMPPETYKKQKIEWAKKVLQITGDTAKYSQDEVVAIYDVLKMSNPSYGMEEIVYVLQKPFQFEMLKIILSSVEGVDIINNVYTNYASQIRNESANVNSKLEMGSYWIRRAMIHFHFMKRNRHIVPISTEAKNVLTYYIDNIADLFKDESHKLSFFVALLSIFDIPVSSTSSDTDYYSIFNKALSKLQDGMDSEVKLQDVLEVLDEAFYDGANIKDDDVVNNETGEGLGTLKERDEQIKSLYTMFRHLFAFNGIVEKKNLRLIHSEYSIVPDQKKGLIVLENELQLMLEAWDSCDGLFMRHCLQYDLPIGFGVVLWRSHQTYLCASAILMSLGGAAGNTFFGHADFKLGRDVGKKMVYGSFHMYCAAVITQEDQVLQIPAVYCAEYIGGNDMNYWDINRPEHIEQFISGDLNGASIAPMVCAANFDTNLPFINRTGGFGSDANVSAELLKKIDLPFAGLYNQIWNLEGNTENSLLASVKQQPRCNTRCFRDHQLYYNHASKRYDTWVKNKGPWGPNVYPGCGKVRSGYEMHLGRPKYVESTSFSISTQ